MSASDPEPTVEEISAEMERRTDALVEDTGE